MNRRARLLAALLLLLCSAGGTFAQTITGRISGTVTDPNGALIAGASVTVTNAATLQSRQATTDANGFFVVTNLPVGTYSVAVERQGFKKSSQAGNDLVADGRLTVNFRLEPGAVTESVEVVAEIGRAHV